MNIIFEQQGFSKLLQQVDGLQATDIVVLLDTNTQAHCWPLLNPFFGKAKCIVVPHGEGNKSIDNAQYIWAQLLKLGINKHALLVNCGGGMITDLGGFAAALYKRGIGFVNIPTTVLAMVDAAIGGKTGVNFGSIKNSVGTYYLPKFTYVNPVFLKTIAQREALNGMAEMIKHGAIYNAQLFATLATCHNYMALDILQAAMQVKLDIVAHDYNEKGMRKLLNYGHTIGHAIEIYSIENEAIMHGEAVALGMLIENEMAQEMGLLSLADAAQIDALILKFFGQLVPFETNFIQCGRL